MGEIDPKKQQSLGIFRFGVRHEESHVTQWRDERKSHHTEESPIFCVNANGTAASVIQLTRSYVNNVDGTVGFGLY